MYVHVQARRVYPRQLGQCLGTTIHKTRLANSRDSIACACTRSASSVIGTLLNQIIDRDCYRRNYLLMEQQCYVNTKLGSLRMTNYNLAPDTVFQDPKHRPVRFF